VTGRPDPEGYPTGAELEMRSARSVAVIGAGPVGLAAAAHALERGLEPIVLEMRPAVGHAVRQWSHVRMFSPWLYSIDGASERLLLEAGPG
jgi:NADPH-dependent 2,4-dienoyl-CoA reductase/sulfur reductase-like enzyme